MEAKLSDELTARVAATASTETLAAWRSLKAADGLQAVAIVFAAERAAGGNMSLAERTLDLLAAECREEALRFVRTYAGIPDSEEEPGDGE